MKGFSLGNKKFVFTGFHKTGDDFYILPFLSVKTSDHASLPLGNIKTIRCKFLTLGWLNYVSSFICASGL